MVQGHCPFVDMHRWLVAQVGWSPPDGRAKRVSLHHRMGKHHANTACHGFNVNVIFVPHNHPSMTLLIDS